MNMGPATSGAPKRIWVVVGAIVACLLWSSAFVGVKIGLNYVSPLFFAGLRFTLAGCMLLPFCGRLRCVVRTLRAYPKTLLLLTFFQTVLLYSLFFVGMSLIPGAIGAIVVGSSPLFAALTAHALMADDRLTGKKALSIVVGIVGVVIISLGRAPWSGGGSLELVGIVMLVGCGISSAIGNIVVAKARKELTPIMLNATQILFGGLILVGLSLVVEGVPNLLVPAEFYYALVWLAVISAVAFTIWFALLKRPDVKVSELNLWKFIVPVFGASFSWLLLPDEGPALVPIIGMVVVAVAIIFYNIAARTQPPSKLADAATATEPKP